MANGGGGVDLVLQGLRGLGQGVSQAGADIGAGKQRRLKEQTVMREQIRKDQERERLENLGISVDEGVAELEELGPLATKDDLARITGPITSEAVESGQPGLASTAFAPFERAIESREKTDRALIAAGSKGSADKRKAELATKKEERAVREETRKVAKSFSSHPVTKRTDGILSAFNDIDSLSKRKPSAGRDTAIVFKVLKAWDPQSTVRESEFDNIKRAKAEITQKYSQDENGNFIREDGEVMPSIFQTFMKKVKPEQRGSFLLDSQIVDLREIAEDSARVALKRQAQVDAQFEKQAKAGGLDEAQIFSFKAKERLGELDAAREAREKEAKAIRDPNKENPDNAPKRVEGAAKQQLIQLNKPQVQAALQKIEEREIREGTRTAPMTTEEQLRLIDAWTKQKGGVSLFD